MTKTVAIIGAGMAGIAAGRQLHANGWTPTLFDKSRGIGGRLATRRSDHWRFDHGCPHFIATDDRFQALLDSLHHRRSLHIWTAGGSIEPPGMSGAARAAAGDLTVMGQAEVIAVEKTSCGWRIADRDGVIEAPGNGAFSALVLALPSPQIMPILKTADITIPALQNVVYAPCWTLMLGFETAPDLARPMQRFDHGPLEKIIDENGKPGRAGTVVVHAGAAWSRQNLERDKEDIAAEMLALFQAASGLGTAPSYKSAHRWRYANVERSAAVPFIWDAAQSLGLAGDWANGPGVEAAFLSGHDLAAEMSTAVNL